MKLFLDDERECPDGWYPVKTVGHAIAVLSGGKVTNISFDHDLGTDATGYTLAVWLENAVYQEPQFPVPEMAIHSANPVGRAKIQQCIDSIHRIALSRE